MMSMEDIMAKLLKEVESIDAGVRKMKSDLSTMSKKVHSYFTSIKHLEKQINKLSISFNQIKNGTLPSDIVQNPRNYSLSMDITTRSGNVSPGACLGAPSYHDDLELEGEIHYEYPVEFEKLKILEKTNVELK